MAVSTAQRSFLVGIGLRPDADDNLAETFSRQLTDHELAEFERIGFQEGGSGGSGGAGSGGNGGQGGGAGTTPAEGDGGQVTRGGTEGSGGEGSGGAGGGTGRPASGSGTTPTEGDGGQVTRGGAGEPVDVEERIRREYERRESERLERLEFIREAAGDDVPRDLVERAMSEVWPQERVSREFLRAVRTRPPAATSGGNVGIHVQQGVTLEALQGAFLLREGFALDDEIFRRREADAMLRRDGASGSWLHELARGADQLPENRAGELQRARDESHRYSSMNMLDFARAALRLAGRTVPDNVDDLIHRAVSTATLTAVFSTSVNMQILQSYLGIEDSTRGWCFETDPADFKKIERGRLTKGTGLKKMARGGSPADITFGDETEEYKLGRYAGHFVIDEMDFIDDSFGATSPHTTRELGELCAEVRPNLVYSILLANAAMRDSVALFHATHGNLKTSSALSADTLRIAKASMAQQTENGRSIRTAMRYLLVPEALDFTGRQLVTSAELYQTGGAAVNGTANPHRGAFTVVSDPRLDNGVTDPDTGAVHAGSETTWYGAAAAGPHTIEVGYRRGTGRAPRMETYAITGKDGWGMGWKANMDIGAKAIDWRGLHKATA